MKLRWRRIFCGVLLVVAGFGAGPLRADDLPDANGITSPSIATSLPNNGDPGGVRKWLGQRGITYNVIYTNDVLSNLSGGNKRGTIDQGKLEGQLTVDLAKLADWQDLTFYANGSVQVTRDYIAAFRGVSEGDVIRYAIAKPEPLRVEHENFRDAVLGKDANIVTLQQGMITVVVAEAVIESARTGQTIALGT